MKIPFIALFFIITFPIFSQVYPYSELNQNWIIQNKITQLKTTEFGVNRKGKVENVGYSIIYNYDENGIEHSPNRTLSKLTDSVMIEYYVTNIFENPDTVIEKTFFNPDGTIRSFQSGEYSRQYFYNSNGKLIRMYLESTNFKGSYFKIIDLVYQDSILEQIIEKRMIGSHENIKAHPDSSDFSAITLFDYYYDTKGDLSEVLIYNGKDLESLEKNRRGKFYRNENELLWKVYYSDINDLIEIADWVIEYKYE